jgi:hypothetical protein
VCRFRHVTWRGMVSWRGSQQLIGQNFNTLEKTHR